MKKLVCSLIGGVVLGFSSIVMADPSDIDNVEVRPDIAKWKISKVIFKVPERQAWVFYDKYDGSDNKIIGTEARVLFENIADDPETPADETDNQFNQLIQSINAGSNIKNTITNAVKTKLGL